MTLCGAAAKGPWAGSSGREGWFCGPGDGSGRWHSIVRWGVRSRRLAVNLST